MPNYQGTKNGCTKDNKDDSCHGHFFLPNSMYYGVSSLRPVFPHHHCVFCHRNKTRTTGTDGTYPSWHPWAWFKFCNYSPSNTVQRTTTALSFVKSNYYERGRLWWPQFIRKRGTISSSNYSVFSYPIRLWSEVGCVASKKYYYCPNPKLWQAIMYRVSRFSYF